VGTTDCAPVLYIFRSPDLDRTGLRIISAYAIVFEVKINLPILTDQQESKTFNLCTIIVAAATIFRFHGKNQLNK
jgi:hypothetical protein